MKNKLFIPAKRVGLLLVLLSLFLPLAAKTPETIALNKPSKDRGTSVMKALWERKSTREFSPKKLSDQDLSDLLWAANGINRPADGKRTAPSALNKQDIQVYACLPEGCYLYNPQKHELTLITETDARPVKEAPVCLILVSDTDEQWAPLDAGIVSQNISLFCAGIGLATVPRGTMDRDALKTALKLTENQQLQLNHPVGYFKKPISSKKAE